VGITIVDVARVYVVFLVVRLGLVGPRLTEDLTSEGVREEGLHIRRVGRDHEIQQVRGGRVIGDEVRGSLGDAQVQNLDRSGAFPGGNFAGALCNLLRVVRSGNQDADGTVKYLVHTIQHQIVVVRGQYSGCDLVTAAQY
jgi:hypothetical protein